MVLNTGMCGGEDREVESNQSFTDYELKAEFVDR